MRKDSAVIFGVSLLITAGVVGGAYYMTEIKQPTPMFDENSSPEQNSATHFPSIGNSSVSAETSNNRTNTPIKCIDPEIGEFWTNAATCEGADLYNRISIADPLAVPPAQERYSNESYKAPTEKSSRKKPNLRQVAKAVPKGLNVSCKFAVGRALEIERNLSAADNPAESTWRENYCKWVNEARDEKCPVGRNFFYYGDLCGYGR